MSSPEPTSVLRSPLRSVLFTLGTLALGALLLELTLQALVQVSSSARDVLALDRIGGDPRRVPDPILGARPNPAWAGHDAAGFRNVRRLDAARVVALGDSQTYGTGVEMEQAWPQQLGAVLGDPVYNMGFPGYGPAHSLVFMDDALTLSPEVVVCTLYAGNDLFDGFRLLYSEGKGPELTDPSAEALASITAAEEGLPLSEKVMRVYTGRRKGWRNALSLHSKLYGLLRATKRALGRGKSLTSKSGGSAPEWGGLLERARRSEGRLEPFEGGGFRTLFTPAYRRMALELDDPRIEEGKRLALEALDRMMAKAQAAGARFVVLTIPTKELVFAPVVAASSGASEAYGELIALEERLWTEVRGELEAAGIEYVEALNALRGSLEAGVQPYPTDNDGHPNPAGQRVIAEALAAELALIDSGADERDR
jgi:hypothetical protein